MPPSVFPVLSIEAALLLAGLALLWRLGVSPAALTRSVPSPLPKWDLPFISFLLFLWLVVAGGILGQVLAQGLFRWIAGPGSDPHRITIIASVGFQFGMLAGCLVFRALPSTRAYAVPTWTRPPTHTLRAGLATFLVALPMLLSVGFVWQYGMERLGFPPEPQELFDLFTHTKSPALLTTLIVLGVVVAPVTEELIFRAGLFRYARQRLPRWAALLGPACVFGALHGNLASFAPLVMLGIIFSLAYERTGNIAVPMIAHGLFNLNSIVLLFAGLDM
jgi:uncharacterized protein